MVLIVQKFNEHACHMLSVSGKKKAEDKSVSSNKAFSVLKVLMKIIVHKYSVWRPILDQSRLGRRESYR